MASNYRRDIDGLRALAILSVILFHAFPSSVPNGFLGVDIFFVISGYLITSNILTNLRSNSFSIVNFYIGRIKRLLPAAFIVLLISTIFANIILFEDEYLRYLSELKAALGYYANFKLINDGNNYFDTTEMFKPLMHFWSLSVEEQFYVIWPICVSVLFANSNRTMAKKLIPALWGMALLASLWLFFSDENGYYSLIARAWQLLAGAGIALLKDSKPELQVNGILATSFAYLLFALGFYQEFKTIGSVQVVAATALYIQAGDNGLKALFTNRLAVWIGLISYSLYLWHWPVLAFFRISYFPDIKVLTYFLLIGFTFFISALTYYLVEKPLRNVSWAIPTFSFNLQSFVKGWKPATVLAAGVFFFLIADRLPFIKFDSKVAYGKYATNPMERIFINCIVGGKPISSADIEWCDLTHSPSVKKAVGIAIGDSHSRALYAGLKAVFQDIHWQILSHHSCNPFAIFTEKPAACQKVFAAFLKDQLRQPTVNFIVFSLANRVYQANPPGDLRILSLLDELAKKGIKVIVVGPVPEITLNMGTCIRKRISFVQQFIDTTEQCSVLTEVWAEKSKLQKDFYVSLRNQTNDIKIIEPDKTICRSDRCEVMIEENALYIDKDHLSEYGAAKVLQSYSNFFGSF